MQDDPSPHVAALIRDMPLVMGVDPRDPGVHVDGHDVGALLEAFESAEQVKGHPSVILAQTVKGKCISFAENNAAFHNGLLTAAQCETAMCDLDNIRKGRA